MDSDRRNRVAALLAFTGYLPAPVAHELIADHTVIHEQNLALQAKLMDAEAKLVLAEAEIHAGREDAARLAGWIIKHPCPGKEMTEVLDLHDRAFPF